METVAYSVASAMKVAKRSICDILQQLASREKSAVYIGRVLLVVFE